MLSNLYSGNCTHIAITDLVQCVNFTARVNWASEQEEKRTKLEEQESQKELERKKNGGTMTHTHREKQANRKATGRTIYEE